MAWWGNSLNGDSFQPKLKNRFIIEMGNGGRLLSVSSVTKPTATIDSKAYKMINHTYNYPGTVKWEPIEIKFVDGNVWGVSNSQVRDYLEDSSLVRQANIMNRTLGLEEESLPELRGNQAMTSAVLWEMLIASGYTPPANFRGRGEITSPEKAANIDRSFGKYLIIHQLKPEGTVGEAGILSTNESWEIYNPIITKISWGDLSYGEDSLVEYTLSITYDYAIHHNQNINLNRGRN